MTVPTSDGGEAVVSTTPGEMQMKATGNEGCGAVTASPWQVPRADVARVAQQLPGPAPTDPGAQLTCAQGMPDTSDKTLRNMVTVTMLSPDRASRGAGDYGDRMTARRESNVEHMPTPQGRLVQTMHAQGLVAIVQIQTLRGGTRVTPGDCEGVKQPLRLAAQPAVSGRPRARSATAPA